eukprot:gnl/MRDRNA2_/MRDRNA2_33553_c0_seq2.p1 gnl/MRDRNA2_/MRDRNA2_33553_c0~~gnl/MRDRNA2_/MRDRNA2_33553_c0_seq2.p1  ORF type:complete len:248 (-),score=37.79 gnl/MRDRNA2_/MRDRNA2_33553_c0_seq2:95-760(-)
MSQHSPSSLPSARSDCLVSARSQLAPASGGYYETPRSQCQGNFETPRSELYITPKSSSKVADFTAVYREPSPVALEYVCAKLSCLPGRPPPMPVRSQSATSLNLVDIKQVFSAARHGRHKEVEQGLQAGFSPKSTDAFGNTLFHVACQNGQKRIAKLAIKFGGDMDAQNFKGNTGLHFLFAFGYADIAEYFISKGASDSILNKSGLAPHRGLTAPQMSSHQ